MQRATGRYVGRVWTRPGCERIYSGSHQQFRDSPSFTTRRFESNLDLPALDRKWRFEWDKQRLQKRWRDGNRLLKKQWEEANGREVQEEQKEQKKMYILPMFPYPSGDLHLGHLRVYTISDVLSRFRRMQGYDVMHPIGWDAFGLPAENAAIERGIDPASWTKQNIKKMKSQLKAMNGHWDWDREFATCDPSFYKHTQRLFLLLHERGLAYQAESLVNYDPVDKTVLANEQVDSNDCSWRSGAKVEKRMLKQWFFKISEFRQELLDDLDHLSKEVAWPERVLAMQRNWLGKSTGGRIKFKVLAYDDRKHSEIEVFTTRPDTLFGVQYLALASTHPIVQELAKTDPQLKEFLDTFPSLPQDSKVGYILPDVRAVNPLAYEDSTPDATKVSIPIYVAPYVLGDYGDGAVMGVPGHDTRDFSFWKQNKPDEPIRFVVSPSKQGGSPKVLRDKAYVEKGELTSHSGPYAGKSSGKASREIINLLESKNLGSAADSWRLRDWLVSRQRYWGTPIPIIHCDTCGPVPVPEAQLPVELPEVEGHWTNGKTGNPLEHAHDWVNTPCPKCGNAAKRDTDTMDTFVDSSWYFMRFPDSKNDEMPFSPESANTNLPVDLYIGGVEHAILHLLYARFISKFIATTPLWPTGFAPKVRGEPFKQVLTQGMVHGKTYSDPSNGRFLKLDEVDLAEPSKPVMTATGAIPNVSFEKMSKSKYNGVDPGTCMETYGADATRAHILFQSPVSDVLEWDEEKIAGITRWLRRLYDFIQEESQEWIAYDPLHLHNSKSYFLESFGFLEEIDNGTRKLRKTKDNQLIYSFGSGENEITHDSVFQLTNIDLKPAEDISAGWRDTCEVRLDSEKKLWRAVQATIISTTDSYSKTYSLNTVVSDLMALTNTIMDHHASRKPTEGQQITMGIPSGLAITREAIMTLVKLMAPITPAFSEECWKNLNHPPISWTKKISAILRASYLHQAMNPAPTPWPAKIYTALKSAIANLPAVLPLNPGSVFDQPFPTSDGTYDLLAPSTHTCAVQVNGKLRFAVEIKLPPVELQGAALEKWITDEILKTKEGKEKFLDGLDKEEATGKGRRVDVRRAKKVIVVRGGKTVNFVV